MKAELILEVIVLAAKLILKLLSMDWSFLKNNNDKIDRDRIVSWIEKSKQLIAKNKTDVIQAENNFIKGLNALLLERYEQYKAFIVERFDIGECIEAIVQSDYMGIKERYTLLTEQKKQEIILISVNNNYSNLDKAIEISKILINLDQISTKGVPNE